MPAIKPSDKASYLAAHYLTAEPNPTSSKPKKRKRKPAGAANDGLLIVADDEWGGTSNAAQNDEDEATIADGPATVAGTSAEFRRTTKSGWKTIGAPIPTDTKDARDAAAAASASEAAEADAVLAAADAERRAEAGTTAEEEAPAKVEVPMMSDGTFAGLQSAKAITAQLRRRQDADREELARINAERAAAAASSANAVATIITEQPEIILRDATGRRVDIAMQRAAARRAAEQAEEARKRALKGEVQLEQAALRREALSDAALMPVARGKDDQEMNAELKAQQRWNDPMAQFLADDGPSVAPGGRKSKTGGGAGRRPLYKGAAPPNRYGIKPGYRWDGVDRGNGFEAERFKALNRKERNKGLDYAWQMDE
ncbi:Pre-mRNA-splicing factor of RES complex-domain-containing protein [Podospora didyma]|uniref:Pre-mRNA-splicing factor of RES complex-domain-containing protein n=1 Tax=Podospora didyma TaxID=330526 RepID=A0AAE0P0F4_9PEZI|nr:Pre-mRNA-splicing factor of RES complex-domain-containing protein [Podospora didyma]